MRQNQRNEKQAAEQTSRLLESSGQLPLPADDEQTLELGRLIRESTGVDLPDANPELRELLRAQLDTLEDKKVVLPRTAPVANLGHMKKKWALAIALMLAIGAWAFYQMNTTTFQPVVATGLKYQTELNGKISGSQTVVDQSNSTSRTETRTKTLPDGTEKADEVQVPATEQLPITMSNGGTTIAVPATTWSAPVTDAIAVPDGGTVLLGGIKRMGDVKSSENKFASGVTPPQQNLGAATATGPTTNGLALNELQQRTTHLYSLHDPGRAQRFSYYLGQSQANAQGQGEHAKGFGGYGGGGGGFTGNLHEALHGFQPNSEQYEPIHENKFTATVGGDAVSTFSIDVDTASYANMRRFINAGQMPPRDSVRIEELINYFTYDYPQPKGDDPFSVNMEFATCPWNSSHKLLRIGLKGKDVHADERPATNLVFLIDVSGSMTSEDKLPLLKRGFQMMVNKLTENDRATIVTYAGNAGVVLEPTRGDQTKKINEAIARLTPGGSTHGSAGIELAYKLAQKHFIKDGVNKVILATDGDLNVGITDDDSLVKLIKEKASEGVFLTVLGFGTGNLKDGKMEKLADNGNGLYAYIDSIREAHKVLVEQMSGSLVTIAKDVKIQIEFNPAEVKAYRLIGYENRMLATQDFDNDKKDAGEIGAGHTVTALYELVTTDQADDFMSAPKGMKYQSDDVTKVAQKSDVKVNLSAAAKSGELLTLALRYKNPDENTSKRTEFTIKNDEKSFSSASADFRFASSVASFGMLLRESQNAGDSNPAMIQEIASAAMGEDKSGYRAEFIDLVRKAGVLCD